MDRFITTGNGGLPFILDDFRWFLGQKTGGNHGIIQAFNNMLLGYGNDFIIQGCTVSGVTGAFSITEGWIMLAGEMIKVNAQGPFDEAVNSKFTKVTTFESTGLKTFQNSAIIDTYEQNRGVISGLVGNLAFDGDSFSDLRNISLISSVDTPIVKETVELGDWNMDLSTSISVPHGLATDNKWKDIRRVEVIIRNDADNLYQPLVSINTANGNLNGAITTITQGGGFQLFRATGEDFDSTDFNSTSFNRGFLTFEYLR